MSGFLQAAAGALHGLYDRLVAAELLAAVLANFVAVELHELHDVELGLLQHLYFADHHVAEREHRRAALGDRVANRVGHPVHTRTHETREDRQRKQGENESKVKTRCRKHTIHKKRRRRVCAAFSTESLIRAQQRTRRLPFPILSASAGGYPAPRPLYARPRRRAVPLQSKDEPTMAEGRQRGFTPSLQTPLNHLFRVSLSSSLSHALTRKCACACGMGSGGIGKVLTNNNTHSLLMRPLRSSELASSVMMSTIFFRITRTCPDWA